MISHFKSFGELPTGEVSYFVKGNLNKMSENQAQTEATKADIRAQIEALIVAIHDIESEEIESSHQLWDNRAKVEALEEMIGDLESDLNKLAGYRWGI